MVKRIYFVSYNILVCDIVFGDQIVTMVNVHMPMVDNDNVDFRCLNDFVATKVGSDIIILGDLTRGDKQFIGPNLLTIMG